MQNNLFLDYLDGSRTLSRVQTGDNFSLYSLITLFTLSKHIAFKDGYISTDSFMAELGKLPTAHREAIFSILETDQALQKALVIFAKGAHSGVRNNYLFSGPLTRALSETSLEKETSIIDSNLVFYFEMPNLFEGESQVLCSFGEVTKLGESQLLTVIMIAKNQELYELLNFSFEVGPDKTLKEVFEETIAGRLAKEINPGMGIAYEDKSSFKTIINGIIYISNRCEEMNEVVNQFATKKSKLETQKKIYTGKPFINLGNEFAYLRLTEEGEVGVRGHYRWQPCGEGREQVKLTFVKPHNRTITRTLS